MYLEFGIERQNRSIIFETARYFNFYKMLPLEVLEKLRFGLVS